MIGSALTGPVAPDGMSKTYPCLIPPALRLTTSSHVSQESQGVVPPAQFVSVPPRMAKVSSTSKVPLRGPVSMTTFVLPAW